MRRTHQAVHGAGAIIVAASFVWLALVNAAVSGQVEYVQDFVNGTPFLSDVWPPERVEPVYAGAEGAMRPVVESPVSFYVHPPRRFDRARITITYSMTTWVPWDLEVQSGTGGDEWRRVSWDRQESEHSGVWRASVEIPMERWYQNPDGRYHARVTVDDLLETGNSLMLREIKAELTGKPRGFRNWINAFRL